MKLSAQHIEEIRKYFLAKGEDERSLIQTSIQSSDLLTLLSSLKAAFNNDEDVLSVAKNLDVDQYIETLEQIKLDYIVQLATLYHSGKTNQDIQALLKTQNRFFLEELVFQKELRLAFNLNERSKLKQQMIQAEVLRGLDTKEVNLAFKLTERNRLKNKFSELEKEKPLVKDSRAPVIKFNWKKLAIAASVIGILITTGLVVFNRNEKREDIAKQIAPVIKNRTINNDPVKNLLIDLLAKEIGAEKIDQPLIVKKAYSMGFAPTEEKINYETCDTEEYLAELNVAITKNSKSGFDSILNQLKNKADSLNKLQDKYKFHGNVLTLYTAPIKPVKIFKIDKSYYIQINEFFYECRKSKTPVSLKKVANRSTQDEIDMINY